MKPGLQLRLSQHLALTPQLQQSIKLLQLSTIELEQEIETFLADNPLLERVDEEGGASSAPAPSASEPLERDAPGSPDEKDFADRGDSHDGAEGGGDGQESEPTRELQKLESDADWNDDFAGNYPSAGNQDDEDGEGQDLQQSETSLRDHLLRQLGETQISERDCMLVRLLIEALDENGYLTQSLEELAEVVPEDFALEPEDLAIALQYLQHLEPTGVGARNARECLALQAMALPPDEDRDLAVLICKSHLELLANRDFAKLRKLTGASDDAIRRAQDLIRSLNPRPGAHFAAVDTRFIVPDVIVRKTSKGWVASINPDAFPRLRVNRLYADILSQQRRGEGRLTGQLQEARWLIKNVQQRFDTIQRVSQSIVDRQRQFFEHGEVAMRPLVLREIADLCELHESTISRVTTQKYMATPRGIFELKYFFGSHVATEAGGACSATAIRALIKQMLGTENPKKPLSDNQIAEVLGQQGIVVARRTIAKYREALGIPAANLRKSI
jgi:RNA polymerase sigma-54 factor